MKPLIDFFVPGIPRPGGSKTATVVRRKGGEIVCHSGRPLTTTRESGKYTAEWRQTVGFTARQTFHEDPARCALRVDVTFYMPRPKCHFRSGKHAGELKPGLSAHHTCKPDATKLMRALEDALTGIVWADDALITQQRVLKIYGGRPGAHVRVYELADADLPAEPTEVPPMPAETPAQPPRQQLAAHEMVAQLRQLFRRTHMSVVNEAADLIESLAAEVVALRAADAAPTTSTALRQTFDEWLNTYRPITMRESGLWQVSWEHHMQQAWNAAIAGGGGGGRGEGR